MAYKYISGVTFHTGALIVQGLIESTNPGDQSQKIQIDGTTVIDASRNVIGLAVSGSGAGSFNSLSIGGGLATVSEAGAVMGTAISGSGALEAASARIHGATAITGAVSVVGAISGSAAGSFNSLDIDGAIVAGASVTAGSFVIGSADINETELEYLDAATPGTASANKVLVVNTQVDLTGINNLTASFFKGDGSGLTNVTAGTTVTNLTHNVTLSTGYNYMTGTTNVTCTMPSGSNTDVVHVKAGNLASGHKVTIQTASAQQIDDGNGPITLESPYAAISLFYVAGTINKWFIV
jgi:hypothetical protein